jgi:SAM-dependent methyltransferase/5-methylcytosine-specific restriction endonuclease McrA
VDIQTHNYYQQNAADLVARYRTAGESMAPLFQRAFAHSARILDVGCGSGRDVCVLRRLGFHAEGVDASPAMIEAAVAADPTLADCLRVDPLPELGTCKDESCDGIICAAVLQHLPEERFFDAAFAFRRILKEHGRLLVSIPLPDPTIDPKTHQDSSGRLFTPIPPEKLQLLLERTGFLFLWREDAADSLGREHRHWCTMLFERVQGASRPLHTVESILNRDSKDATYKLALIRALAEIAQTQYAQAVWTPHGKVKIPTELIARKWLEYYWPLFASADFIPQKYGEKPDGAKCIAFRKQLSGLITASWQAGLGDIAGFAASERSNALPAAVQKAFATTIGKLKGTVWNMPVRYAGPGEFSIFQYDRADHTVVMDASLWREFSLTGSWIADACILRWSELTAQISKGELQPSQIVDLLLRRPDPERDTAAARSLLKGIRDLRCVWTDLPLRRFDVDHAIPYALWRNNDLWNLFPASGEINNQKRDKLPTHRLISHRQDCIVACWEHMQSAYPVRFMSEATALCGIRKLDVRNWQNPLFHAFQEAIEITAVQRGVPRWEPPTDMVMPAPAALGQPAKRPVPRPIPTINLPFVPSLKIACGHFREAVSPDDIETRRVPNPHGRLDARRHFLAIAEGDSMSHGNNPINDGDMILLERIDPMHAGSLSAGGPIAVEYRDPATGDLCYALKKVAKTAAGKYLLVSTNRAYSPIPVDRNSVYPFARLVKTLKIKS